MAVVISSIARHFKKDDVLFTHCHSGTDRNRYGSENSRVTKYKICNEAVSAILKIELLSEFDDQISKDDGEQSIVKKDSETRVVSACAQFLERKGSEF